MKRLTCRFPNDAPTGGRTAPSVRRCALAAAGCVADVVLLASAFYDLSVKVGEGAIANRYAVGVWRGVVEWYRWDVGVRGSGEWRVWEAGAFPRGQTLRGPTGGVEVLTQGPSTMLPTPDPHRPSWRNAGGFAYLRRPYAPGITVTYVAVPAWLPLLLVAGPVAVREMRSRRHRRRAAAGRCVHCGYDLRVTPARCPRGSAERREA